MQVTSPTTASYIRKVIGLAFIMQVEMPHQPVTAYSKHLHARVKSECIWYPLSRGIEQPHSVSGLRL